MYNLQYVRVTALKAAQNALAGRSLLTSAIVSMVTINCFQEFILHIDHIDETN